MAGVRCLQSNIRTCTPKQYYCIIVIIINVDITVILIRDLHSTRYMLHAHTKKSKLCFILAHHRQMFTGKSESVMWSVFKFVAASTSRRPTRTEKYWLFGLHLH